MTKDALIIRHFLITGEGREAAAEALTREKRRAKIERLTANATRKLTIPKSRRTL